MNKKKLIILLALCNLSLVFSQITFSTDSFKSSFKMKENMDHELFEKISFRVPIDQTLMKYDKVIFSVRVYELQDDEWTEPYYSNHYRVTTYPTSPSFKDNYGDLKFIEFKNLKIGSIDSVDDYKYLKNSNTFKYRIDISGFYKDGYKYENGRTNRTYKFSKTFLKSEYFSFKIDQVYKAYSENRNKIYNIYKSYYPFNATPYSIKLAKEYRDHPPHAAYELIEKYFDKKNDKKTIVKIQEKMLSISENKKKKKEFYHVLRKIKDIEKADANDLVKVIMDFQL